MKTTHKAFTTPHSIFTLLLMLITIMTGCCQVEEEGNGHTEHSWNDGVITTQPTETAEGVKTFTCKECDATKTEAIPKLTHTHKFADAWSSDETKHWHAANCGHDLKKDEAEHTFDSGVVSGDDKTFTCSECGYKKIESVSDPSHTHTFADAWTFDETKHWHDADCGHDVKKDEAEHTFNDGEITTPATEETEGVKTLTCTACGYAKTEAVAKLSHTFDTENWEKDSTHHWHKATCKHSDEKGDYAEHSFDDGVVSGDDKTFTCSECGYKKIESVSDPSHTHTFADTWSFDETKHWHAPICEHGLVNDEAEHTFNDGEITTPATEETEGVRTLTCTVCGYVKTEAVAKLPHTFDTENWENDATHHWHKATCEHSDEKGDYAEHVGDWTVKTPADYGMPKVEEKTCTVCSYSEERTGDYTGDFYMIVSDRILVNGNIVITGTVSRGSINTGDKIAISGYDEELTALELYKGIGRTQSESLGYGDGEISIHLGTVANSDNIKRRAVVSKSGTMQSYNKFSANIYLFEEAEGGRHTPIFSGYSMNLKIGDVEVGTCKIILPDDVEMVMSGETCTITITLNNAIPLYEGLGFTIIEGSGSDSATTVRGTVMSLLNE